jgi:hypothetical protein
MWKTWSHMENTESAVKYGKHGVWRKLENAESEFPTYWQREIWKTVIK